MKYNIVKIHTFTPEIKKIKKDTTGTRIHNQHKKLHIGTNIITYFIRKLTINRHTHKLLHRGDV